MPKTLLLQVSPTDAGNESILYQLVATELALPISEIKEVQLLKRSIDARSTTIKVVLQVLVYFRKDVIPIPRLFLREYPSVNNSSSAIVVGAGPAGMFAALRLIELGIKPIVLERGKRVRERRRDLAILNREHLVNPESNYCFGEGGAGTYSDGKLYTRSNKRGNVDDILHTFVAHGADSSILIDAHPHIGTNKLPQIIVSIRESILNAGGEIHFETKVTDFIIRNSCIKGVITQKGAIFESNAVILATGHSARDIFELLYHRGITIEAKPFALGLRIEHQQTLIDQIQYKCLGQSPRGDNLPPASYTWVEQIDGRGVYSFCMCPGGIIAPCATNMNEIVTNGWSPSRRNNPFANSGIVTEIREEDWQKYYPTIKKELDAELESRYYAPDNQLSKSNSAYNHHGLSHSNSLVSISKNALVAMYFQASVEKAAWLAGGCTQRAPAQRLIDFIHNKVSSTLPICSYLPGVISAPLTSVLPNFVSSRLQSGLQRFGKRAKQYYTNEAILVGVESRTSSPVRIPRDKIGLEHPEIKGLFPCGEGAGYAGGIISAAIDGVRCAEAIKQHILK